MEPKWIFRMESDTDDNGLWYNNHGEFVLGIADAPNCKTKELPMGYDERYKKDGRDWHSGCVNREDLTSWFSPEDAKYLTENGFTFRKFLATEYAEYPLETLFIKDTCLEVVNLSVEEVFQTVVTQIDTY